MKLSLYQIDAFADKLFSGNPAAVIPLEKWIDDLLMQQIAEENNLAETVFFVPKKDGFHIRWFTPELEIDLCGHATLATAFVLFNYEGFAGEKISLQSRSGILTVTKNQDLLTLDFPADEVTEVPLTSNLTSGFKETPIKVLKGKTDYVLVFENEEQVKNCKPDFKEIAKLNARGIIITSKGKQVDFVSRFFGPQAGVDEDPVTGSAHTTLTPYWAKELDKKELSAAQLSARGGKLWCKLNGNRVEISGRARLFSTGLIYLEG